VLLGLLLLLLLLLLITRRGNDELRRVRTGNKFSILGHSENEKSIHDPYIYILPVLTNS